MIPKILHYCWFGKGLKPSSFKACLDSWKKYCPDFEIKEWNETNAPNKDQAFYKNALRKKRFAFVADCVRAKVLYEQGGVYVDTDMFLLKPIDVLLQYNFFIGEEIAGRIAFGLFGGVAKHTYLQLMNDFYNQTEFNYFSPPVITHTFSALINKNTLGANDMLLPPDYFYPLPYEARREEYSKYTSVNSFAVHLWEHSWKARLEENSFQIFKNLAAVVSDYLLFGYSTAYVKRYGKEFSRKLYHKCIKKEKFQDKKVPLSKHSLKVVHLTVSPRGGAGIAALRLHNALRTSGVTSAFISKTLTIDFDGITRNDPFLYEKPTLLKRVQLKIKSIFLPTSLQKFNNQIEKVKGKLDYEMLSSAFSHYKIQDHPLVREADILHLHWVNGLIDFPTFFTVYKKPIVWTLHDLNPFQGLFHYNSDQIRNYDIIGDLDNEQKRLKKDAISQINNGAIVAPSKWLLNEAENTNVFSNFSYKHSIPNSIDLEVFYPICKKLLHDTSEVVKDAITLLFISDSITGNRKGADILQDALEQIKDISINIMLIGKGDLIVENQMVKIIPLGYINDSKQIVDYYSMADVLVLPSREDNLPNVMLEAMACGIPVIGFPIGGLREHIINGQTGLLAEEISVFGLKKTIERFQKTRLDYNKEIIRSYAEEHFKSENQATSYLKLYLKMIE